MPTSLLGVIRGERRVTGWVTDARMGKTLDALRRLQDIERRLADIRRNIETKARRVDIQKRNVQKADERLLDSQRAALELQAKIDAMTLEIAVREETIAKHREALHRAKTNKDYSAILAAMNTEKADTSKEEDELLRQMEQLQAIRDGQAAISEEKAKHLERLAVAESALTAYEGECAADRDRFQSSRDACAEGITAGVLSVFTRIADRHDGEALAAVVQPHPKRTDYACSGCNLNLTLPIVDALLTRDEIQICQACGRILYVDRSSTEKTLR